MSDFLSGIYADALKPAKSPFFDPTPTTPRATPGDGSGNHSMRSTGDMPAAFQPAPVAPAPSPYAAPSGSVTAPNISASPTSPNLTRDIYAPQLNDVTQKLNAAYQAPRPGMARQIIGGVLTGMNPRNPIGGLVSGETQRQQTIQPLTQQEDLLSKIIQMNRQNQLGDAELENKAASTDYLRGHKNYLDSMIDIKNNPTPKTPTNALELFQQDPAKAKQFFDMQQEAKPDKTPNEKEQEISDYLTGHKMPNTPEMRDKARTVLATRNRAPKDPEVADLSKQLKQAQLEKLKEPTADEQRRSDLADNLNENLTQLEDIAKRRPELFGPLAGRLTAAKQWYGAKDPDVAALKNIEEQTGLAMVGAHAMRNAQHAEKAAQSITGANKNTADVLLSPQGPIASARKSLATFKADAGRRRSQIDAVTGTTEPTPSTAAPQSTSGAQPLPSFADWKKTQGEKP